MKGSVLGRRKRRSAESGLTPGLMIGLMLATASGYPVGALGVAAASPLLLTAIRLAVAASAMTALAFTAKATWPRGRVLAHCVVVGVLGHCVHFASLYAGLAAGVPASVSALIFGMQPVLTAVLATALLGERLGWLRLLGLVLGVAAVLVALWHKVASTGRLDVGSALTLLGLLGLSGSIVWQQRFCRGVDLRAASAVQLGAAVPPLVVLAVLERGAIHDAPQAALVIAWLVVVNSMLGTRLMLATVARIGAARTSVVSCLVPAMAAIMSWPMLGQRPTGGVLLGLALGVPACLLGSGVLRNRRGSDNDRRTHPHPAQSPCGGGGSQPIAGPQRAVDSPGRSDRRGLR